MSELLVRFVERGLESTHAMVIEGSGASVHTVTYAEVLERAARVARGLEIAPRERVALLIHPGADFLAAFYGVLLAGGCVVVLSPLHPAPESHYFCEDSSVRNVLVSTPLHKLGVELAGVGLAVRDIEPLAHDGALPLDWGRELFERARRASESDAALQLYTSGTTGRPKGAVLTHQNIGVQQRLVREAWGFTDRDVLLHSLPLHHMHGLAIALLTAIGAGATTRMRSFDAREIWEEMKDATVFMGVPAMYHRLFVAFDAASQEERQRFASNARALRLATSGSAAMPVTLAERWRDITGRIPLERFGMTEIGVGITNSLDGERFAGCVGLPLPTVEARIVSEDGSDADTGELWIRGPSVFVGYHRREDETKSAFVPDESGGDPWFRTGDTVTRDASLPTRPYRILGRTSVDILKSGGYKLSALEIEEVLREHGGVLEVAVVGVPDEAWGDRVVACVVRRDGVACEVEDLKAVVRAKLAPYKVPKDILFFEDLPKNALGKVVKPDLKRQLIASE